MKQSSDRSTAVSRAAGAVQRRSTDGVAQFKDNREKSTAQLAMDKAATGKVAQRAPEDEEKK
jgi:hypothetical protein